LHTDAVSLDTVGHVGPSSFLGSMVESLC